MDGLLGDSFWPVTVEIGLVNASLDECDRVMWEWRTTLYPEQMSRERLDEGFPQVLHRLEPLTAGYYPREMFVSCGSEWTVYFNCARWGTDSQPVVGVVSKRLNVRSVRVVVQDHLQGKRNPHGLSGSVQFGMTGPEGVGALRGIRSVSAHFESRWEWEAYGEVQPFEEVERYGERRIRDRLTPAMVERYCQALGIDVFNPAAYGPSAVFYERHRDMVPPVEMSIAEAQHLAGLA